MARLLKTLLSYLKSAHLNLPNCKFCEETKMPYLGTFGQEFWKSYCQIWNQHPWICLNPKYRELKKMPKFGTKSALFGLFLARILKNYSHIWNQHFRISVVAKFCEEGKCLNLGPKMPYLGIFDGKCLIWAFLTKNALFG